VVLAVWLAAWAAVPALGLVSTRVDKLAWRHRHLARLIVAGAPVLSDRKRRALHAHVRAMGEEFADFPLRVCGCGAVAQAGEPCGAGHPLPVAKPEPEMIIPLAPKVPRMVRACGCGCGGSYVGDGRHGNAWTWQAPADMPATLQAVRTIHERWGRKVHEPGGIIVLPEGARYEEITAFGDAQRSWLAIDPPEML
jgi:hypothetical protein